MIQKMKHRFGISLLSGLICLMAVSAFACSVPVFRYALEKWSADDYQMIVFHKGELNNEQSVFTSTATEDSDANFKIKTVDLDAKPSEKMLDLWKKHPSKTLPHAIILNPHPQPAVVWQGELKKETFENLTDSPLRQKIVRQLVNNETAVWVLLEGKDKKQNDAAFAILTTELAHLQKSLKLPEIEEADIEEGSLSGDPANLKISFPLLRLSKNNPREAMLIQMLLASESDLRDQEYIDKPMAFPIFGRGRALYALIGEGINKGTITTACHFLVGSCSCEVKEQNPGTDLLMSVDWEKSIEEMISIDTSSPPLTGITSMVGTTIVGSSTAPPGDPSAGGSSSEPTLMVKQSTMSTAQQTPEASNVLLISLLVFLGLGVVVVVGVSLVVVSKSQ